MPRPVNEEMMYRAAALYCNGDRGQKLTKTEIAKRLDTSLTQVVRWLEAAEERNIIRVQFRPPRIRGLETALRSRYELKEAVVVPATAGPDHARKLRGYQLARYFNKHITAGMTVAVSGGSTLWEMALQLPSRPRPNIKLVPAAIIGRGPQILHIDPTVILSVIWAKSGGRPNDDKAPEAYSTTVSPFRDAADQETGLISLRESLGQVAADRKVQDVVARMKAADALFLSCGPADPSAEYFEYSFHSTVRLLERVAISPKWLAASGAVGDLSYAFLNDEGELIPECNFFLTIASVLGTEGLRKLAAQRDKHVVLSSGDFSEDIVRVALKAKLCNVLVTDDKHAEKLLELRPRNGPTGYGA